MVTISWLSSEVFSNALRGCEMHGVRFPLVTVTGQAAGIPERLEAWSMAGQVIALPENHQRSVACLNVGRPRFGTDESSEGLLPRAMLRTAAEVPFSGGTGHLETPILQSVVEGIRPS
jgi:hypothetical protein